MEFVDKTLNKELETWQELLVSGDLLSYEQSLSKCMNEVYNIISDELLPAASLEVAEQLKEKGRSDGGRKIEMRPYTFRLGTGKQIEVPSPYVLAIISVALNFYCPAKISFE